MTQFIISCAVELLRLVTSVGIMTSLLNKFSISIKIHVVINRYGVCLVIVSKLLTKSVGSRRELVANSVHMHRRRDATRQISRIVVGGVHWV